MSQHIHVSFDYKIRFEKEGGKYRLVHYNQWHESDDKTLDDIRVLFEGKDLQDNDLPDFKKINWESCEDGQYDCVVKMRLYETKTKEVGQIFALKSLDKVEKQNEA